MFGYIYMANHISNRIIRIIHGDIRTKTDRAIAALLHLLSVLYGFGVTVRLFLYRHRFLRQQLPGCPVISIGNITVGGTGKTPVTEMFARSLRKGGRKVAILSRGYKKKRNRRLARQPEVVSDGRKVYLTSEQAGDEPYMLAKNLDGVAVLVDKKRLRSSEYALKKTGADILLLDDGFQYLKLGRQHDIVLIDCTNPFGYNRLLPRGLLREPLSGLKRADFVFITKREKLDSVRDLRKKIHRYSPKAEILECVHDPQYFEDLYSGEKFSLSYLKKRKIAALSAIADPEGFEDTLKRLGADIVISRRFIDHHRFTKKEIESLISESIEQGIDIIVTTEKDAVRIPRTGERLRMVYLRVEIKIIHGAADFHDFVSTLCYD